MVEDIHKNIELCVCVSYTRFPNLQSKPTEILKQLAEYLESNGFEAVSLFGICRGSQWRSFKCAHFLLNKTFTTNPQALQKFFGKWIPKFDTDKSEHALM